MITNPGSCRGRATVGGADDDAGMPSIAHEAALELLRGNPPRAAVLLQALDVPVPPGAAARLVSADLTASAAGYTSATQTAAITSGQVTTLNFTLAGSGAPSAAARR